MFSYSKNIMFVDEFNPNGIDCELNLISLWYILNYLLGTFAILAMSEDYTQILNICQEIQWFSERNRTRLPFFFRDPQKSQAM